MKAATTESLLIVGTTALLGVLDSRASGGCAGGNRGLVRARRGVGAIGGTALNRLVGPRAILLGVAGVLLVAALVQLVNN